MKSQHRDVLLFCHAIRTSFLEAAIVYTNGGCYGFYKILHAVFPAAIPYMTDDENHIVSLIGDRYYDVHGEFVNLKGEVPRKLLKLTEAQMEYWDTVITAQRIEFIMKKYNKD